MSGNNALIYSNLKPIKSKTDLIEIIIRVKKGINSFLHIYFKDHFDSLNSIHNSYSADIPFHQNTKRNREKTFQRNVSLSFNGKDCCLSHDLDDL